MPLLQQAVQRIQGANGAANAGNFDGVIVTTEALNTAAGATLTYTVNMNACNPSSLPDVQIWNGTNNAGDPSLQLCTPGNGKVTITVVNRHATNAFNGSLQIGALISN